MKTAKPVPVSAAPGYDNQPNFSGDGNRLLFAGNRDGKQIDIYGFDRATKAVTQLTRTPENENSPTSVPAGAGPAGSFTVVQSEFDKSGARPDSPIQRLWRFNSDGNAPQLILADINPVGYHAWISADSLVLFVLGAAGEAGDAANRQRQDRQGGGRRREHRPIAPSHSRERRSPALCIAREMPTRSSKSIPRRNRSAR